MSIYDFSRDVRGDGRQRRLLVDEDFSWSEPPSRRGRQAEAGGNSRSGLRTASGSFPQPTAAHVDGVLYEAPSVEDGVAVRDLRGGRDSRVARGWAGDAGAVRDDLEGLEPDEAYVDEGYAEDLYLDQDSGGVALSAEGRRTIVITGHGSERNLPARRRQEAGLRVYERPSFKPDRIALWAFLLGLALLLGATTSSHAATLVQHLPH